MSAVEGTIITSALPTIAADLGGGDAYIWVPNAFLLAQVAVLPLFGQASNVFGRRLLLLGAVALFTLGSGLSGAATNMRMLIAARTVQGLGGGGINLLIETIVTDIVALRERGKWMAIVQLGATIGATLGPFLGGLITDRSTWFTFAALFLFLRVNYERNISWSSRFKRVDFYGNAIFVAAIAAVLIALTWGGTVYGWGTFHILVPLCLGFFGVLLFTAFEWTPRLCPEPSFPRQIVSNRTSAAALGLTFLHAILAYWTYYFLPIYFQAVKGQSPMRSGVSTLPTFAGGLGFAVLGGVLLSVVGKYKPLQLAGFAAVTVSFGLFSLLDAKSSDAAWVCFQLISVIGGGGLVGILLPAVQAPLDESLVATATGVWSFARYFGCIWGVTIPAAIFNNESRRIGQSITNVEIASIMTGDRAYQHATAAFLNSIDDDAVRQQVISVFTGALQKEIDLRTQLNTEFGIEDEKKKDLENDTSDAAPAAAVEIGVASVVAQGGARQDLA
ncbi:putative efflux pump antibiotic resistance protein [Phaeoacremonium minimum UCRPA7]|uniref:Putative efflux pump antibiotic resistance protein n=1 Tax=Phaeoacremonium minimum (strain UCR-PA7) TaxID=1286976 RepID=R8B8J2_PHAM7|nr:putative efflux pump antibiotic resistance protein [Phaeoacremonium minimum UCRPA7]EON95629.1 putative efflux pump antibiotic resistance protein [Phaeoacremonium minimum UCRPA7]